MPVALFAHGCGSSAEFVWRAFGSAVAAAGYTLVSWDERSGDVDRTVAQLDALVTASGATLVGGISLGAMAAARWAAGLEPARRAGLDGLVLALPAWSGAPGATAALSRVAAEEVTRDGLEATTDRFSGEGWVGAELARAWRSYGETTLVAALRATSRSAGPTLEDLSRIEAPTGLLGFDDDAFHPIEVAEAWTGVLPRSALGRLALQHPASDLSLIGRTAVDAWQQARSGERRTAEARE